MKKITFLLLIISQLIINHSSYTQNFFFNNQSQIDDFQINFPGVTEIGDLKIKGDNITNLDGLSVLTAINGYLKIGDMYGGNPILENLNGLINVNSIGGELLIRSNDTLTSLSGLDNIEPNSIESIHIGINNLLEECVIQSICEYLVTVGGDIALYGNGPGCNDELELQILCGDPNLCLYEGIEFTSQEQIDNFPFDYPDCTEIAGSITISGEDITNLYGLNQITTVWGSLLVWDNDILTNFAGLENLNYIDGALYIGDWYNAIHNPSLINCEGLEGLLSIGGALNIDFNDSLISLTGLENLQSTVMLAVTACPLLQELSSLHNINSISSFWIIGNNSLESISGFNNLTSASRIQISSNPSLTNLSGFQNIQSMNDYFHVGNNDNLTSIQGFTSLETLGGSMSINSNPKLSSLEGLNQLTTIDEFFSLSGCDSLPYLSGLNSLQSIGEHFRVSSNNLLKDLSFFENITSIGDYLEISYNHGLLSLSGLDSLNEVGTYIEIYNNDSLQNILSLQNLNIDSLDYINIHENDLLTHCHALNICEYIAGSGEELHIWSNNEGCNSVEEVEEACLGLSCLPEGITFTSQDQIDNFQNIYNVCEEIEGNVLITSSEGSITNLNGLNQVLMIGGNLKIYENSELPNLSGLENLTSIGGNLHIEENELLNDITALNNIAPSLSWLHIRFCDNLTSLNGLEGITNIENTLNIQSNPALQSLSGLNNLETVESIYIKDNANLLNLSGLNLIDSINDNVIISNNASLVNIEGLDSLSFVGGNFTITNSSIASLHGLENLISIDGNLQVGENPNLIHLDHFEVLEEIGDALMIFENPSLSNIQGLFSLNSIGSNSTGESLSLYSNPLLNSLSGLDSINPNSITNISIHDNAALSECDVMSICQSLSSPNGSIEIYNNAPNCASLQDVVEACFVSTNEFTNAGSYIQIVPNPAKYEISILGQKNIQIKELCIFSLEGRKLICNNNGEKTIDVSMLQAGLYFVEIATNVGTFREKLIIE